ncbi:MAG: STAS domain-containing protein [Ginsengibacter sp.]
MKVKIDTKEKMQVIVIQENILAANMTEELRNTLLKCLNEPVSNVVVDFGEVNDMALEAANMLLNVQQDFYEAGHSMVFCRFQPQVEDKLDKHELLEVMNVTPTESEAWDIVQMEEIERELL